MFTFVLLLCLLVVTGFAVVGAVHAAKRAARSRFTPIMLRAMVLAALVLLTVFTVGLHRFWPAAAQSNALKVEILAGYNLVVDSNVSSPSTFSPSAATVAARVCNTSDSDITNARVFIGDYTGSGVTGGTPGTYPSRGTTDTGFDSQHPALAGSGPYAFTHEGGRAGLSDASRSLGTLKAGDCVVQYWTFSYPRCENSEEPPCTGDPVWGNSVKPEDDLWLTFDVWASGSSVTTVYDSWKMYLRNEISAMANKIEPNGNPGGTWFNTDPATIKPGGVITTNGILYRIGNVRFGFDNDGDYLPDYNFWVQPIGDASQFDSGCFRLIRTSGIITVAGGTDKSFTFTDQLYFTNAPDPKYPEANRIPTDNTNVIGEVYYTFLAMGASCNAAPTPYQEAASGYDNEKFNGDFGSGGVVPVDVDEAVVTIDKIGDPGSITVGQLLTYTIPFKNESKTESAGLVLLPGGGSVNNPLVISDSIPAGAFYRKGSATSNLTSSTVSVFYSTDNGQTFTSTEPAAGVTTIQWWLDDALPPGVKGWARFAISIPVTYSGPPVLENCAGGQFGTGTAFAEACEQTTILGNYAIGDYVWQDDNFDTTPTSGEPPLENVTVWLYYDKTGDGRLGSDDMLLMTDTTDATGIYSFTQLLNGNYLVVVDKNDPDLPFGYNTTTDDIYAVTLNGADFSDADFGFGPALSVNKTLLSGSPAYEGRDVTYKIEVTNLRPGDGTGNATYCTYETWARQADPTHQTGSLWTNVNDAFAVSELNSLYASTDIASQADSIAGTNFNLGSVPGNITKVEVLFPVYLNQAIATGATGDSVTFNLFYSDVSILPGATPHKFDSVTEVNTLQPGVAKKGFLTYDATSLRSWQMSDFTGTAIDLVLGTAKGTGPGGAYIYLDAMGFRITTDQTCGGGASDTLNPVPLKDTFDASLLEFVSADPSQTSVSSGVINWTNIGPLYAGQTKEITVTFKGLDPGGTATLTNTATVTNAYFATGERANGGEDSAVTTITQTGSISGVVWSEYSGGTTGWAGTTGYESGDYRIPGVIAELYQCTGLSGPNTGQICTSGNNKGTWTQIATTTTGINGKYLFEGLLDGYYRVVISTTTLPSGSGQTADPTPNGTGITCGTCDNAWGAESDVLNLLEPVSGASHITNINFGYTTNPMLYGTIWQDTDADGTFDPTEPGLDNGASGITVSLSDSSGVINTTQTDTDGYYEFTTVGGGGPLTGGETYTITVGTGTFPSGTWTQTGDPDSTLDDEHTITLATGQISGPHNFGYRGSSSIGDTIFYDINGNGIEDTAEGGINDVTVYLYSDANGDGIVNGTDSIIATDTTDGNGYYLFSNLPPGNWTVVVDSTTLPDGLLQTADVHETTPVFDDKTAVTTTGSDNINDANFGYQPFGTASIGDTVWRDMDGNGVQSGSRETGLSGVAVMLFRDNGNGTFLDSEDPQVGSLDTDSSGKYLFENLPAGVYFVDVLETDADVPTDPYHSSYVLSTNNSPLSVTLTTGQSYLNADFGFAPPGALGNLIYQDNNQNGQYDLGEPGISGVTVQLYETGNPTPVAAVTTSASGEYTFTGLMPYTYTVKVDTSTLPTGYSQTGDPDYPAITSTTIYETCAEDPKGLNSFFGGCDSERTSYLFLGQVDFSRDFGYLPPRSIGDRVWLDSNENGVQDDGERGIGGITVTVTLPSGGGTFATTTDIEGYYSFGSDVLGNTSPDGTFTVNIDPGPTYTYASDPDTGVPDGQASLVISGDYFTDTLDFGLKLNGSLTLSGTVFADLGGDTDTLTDTFTSGDTPYQGITVLLYNSNRALIGSATTDASGHYTFTGLFGNTNYTVVVQKDSTLQQQTLTARPDGTVNADFSATTDSSLSSRVTVTMRNTSPSDIDFGFFTDSAILSITKLVTPGGSVVAGDVLTYTIRVANSGTLSATNVMITDSIPANTSYIANSLTLTPTSAGAVSEPAGGLIVAHPITIEAKSAVTFTFSVTVDTPLPAEVTAITNTAWLSDSGGITKTSSVTNPIGTAAAVLLGAIGDTVWLDANANGGQEPGENGLGNVVVELYNITNTLVATTTTDPNGNYLFKALPPGSYTVTVRSNSLPTWLNNITYDEDNGTTNADGSTQVTLQADQTHNTADFGYNMDAPGLGAIGDWVWIDANGDGRQDPGEVGLPNVTLHLYTDPDNNGVYDTLYTGAQSAARSGTGLNSQVSVTASPGITVTDETGHYMFTLLPPGTYKVVVVDVPVNYTQTGDPDSIIDAQTSYPIVIGPGDNYIDADFGYQPAAGTAFNIGDTIWLDANRDGNQDANEPGLPNVTVTLLNRNGAAIGVAFTTANGQYSFAGLPNDNYTVWVNDAYNQLAGLSLVSQPGGGNGIDRSSLTLNNADDLTQDFGYFPGGVIPAIIGDFVFLDQNGNNTLDSGEPGLGGITVTLTLPGGEIKTTTTNNSGFYWFGGLTTNTYTVTVTSPAGLSNSVDPDGGLPNQSVVTLSAGNLINLAQDFGYKANNPNTIAGTLWEDIDTNGILTATETNRFAGVTVVLRNNIGQIISTAVTDSDGNFSFTGLPDGNYTVDVSDLYWVLRDYRHADGPNDGSDNNSQPIPYTVSVSGGQTNSTADFGFYRANAGVGNRVWLDSNGNGLQDSGEAGLGGITVTLTVGFPAGGEASVTTVTDSSGIYTFTNLIMGQGSLGSTPSFTITVSDPAGYQVTLLNQGNNNELDSDNPRGQPVVVQVGRVNNSYDFGYVPTSGIAISKLISLGTVAPRQTVTYTVLVTNTGGITLNPVSVTDTMAVGVSYISNSASQTPTSVNGQTLHWADVTGGAGLAPSQTLTLTMNAQVTDTVGSYGNLVVVEATHPGGVITGTDSVSVIVTDPALQVAKGVMPEGVVDGLITFTIRITNTGPSTLDQVPLVDHFSGPMVYVGGSPPANLVDNVNQTIGWTDLTTVTNLGGNLRPGQGYVLTTVFSITVQTDNYTLTNRAVVSNAVDILNNSANDADDAVDVIIQPTAIELLYFTGSRQGADVLLAWATAIELDNYGFRLMRSLTNSLDTAEQIGFRAGQGHGTGSGSTYSLTDIDPGADTLYYWLVDVDFDGKETPHGPVIIDSSGVNSGNGRIIFLPLIVKE